MSGPKVVRIVTREEVLEICRAEIARIDAAIAEWESKFNGDGLISVEDRRQIQAKRSVVTRLLEQDRFLDVQKQAPLAVESIRLDAQLREEARREQEARRLADARSLRFTAAALLERCKAETVVVPSEVMRELESAAAGRGTAQTNVALERAFQLVSASEATAKQDQRQQLARSLVEESIPISFDERLQAFRKEALGNRFDELDRNLLKLSSLENSKSTAEFSRRLDELVSELDPRRQNLLLDALRMELRVAVKDATEWAHFRSLVAAEKAVAVAAGDVEAIRDLMVTLERRIADRDLSGAQTELSRVRECLAVRRGDRMAAENRRAVLQGLKSLGYDVREGMSTSWVQNKQLVVRHAKSSDLAVELGGNGENGRLQARAVAVAGATRTRNDRQVEESWCGDLTKLQALLAAEGGQIAIEKATPVGVQALKVVANPSHYDDGEIEGPKTRQLP